MGLIGPSSSKEAFVFEETDRSGQTFRFKVTGQVTAKEASQMEFKLEQAVKSGGKTIIINMYMVKAFSSAGIRVVLNMYKKLKAMGGSLKIESPSENVRNVIGMVALDDLLLR